MKFTDMTEEQKANVLDKNRGMCTDDEWWYDFIYTDAEERLEAMGFYSPDIGHSGFSCQGSGASFTTKNINIEMVLRKNKVWNKFRCLHNHIREDGFTIEIRRNCNRYLHEQTMRVSETYRGEFTDKQFDAVSELCDIVETIAKNFSANLYRELENSYNDHQTDEYLTDHIIANDYSFCPHHYTLI